MRRGVPVLVLPWVLILAAVSEAGEYKLTLPLGLQEHAAYVPDDNRPTREKIALGKQLFWDKRWSRNGTVACVSCHDPTHGWADSRQFSLTFEGKPTARHRSEEHTSELQSQSNLVCRLLLEKKKKHKRHQAQIVQQATVPC